MPRACFGFLYSLFYCGREPRARTRITTPPPLGSNRYYRSATLRWPFNLIVNGGKPISFINDPFFKSFLSHGMILVSVDVRGTGASFGTHPGPWSPEEQQVRTPPPPKILTHAQGLTRNAGLDDTGLDVPSRQVGGGGDLV